MLKRIKKIIKTGVFRKDDRLASCEFDKLTLFYGLNTHGKTTLKDVFQSITQNDPQVLFERQSIPDDTKVTQSVVMTFLENGCETDLKFENNEWSPDTLKDKILIFDNEFIHKNLITGLTVTRENKETLSDFILGEEGVKLSEEIRDLNKDVREKKKELIEPPSLKKLVNNNEKQSFLTMKVEESDSDLEKLKEQKTKELNNLSNSDNIKNLNDVKVPELKLKTDLEETLKQINCEFHRDYKEVTAEVMSKINKHLNDHVLGENGLIWIAKGFTEHKKGTDCPFCGQTVEEVGDLMDAYNNYFNENYKKFTKEISDNLANAESQLTSQAHSISIFSDFQTLKLEFGKYSKYNSSIEYDVDLSELQQAEEDVKTVLKEENKTIGSEIKKKNREPHKALDNLALSRKFEGAWVKLEDEIRKVADNLEPATKEAKKLKDDHSSMTEESMNQSKSNLQKEIKEIELKISRLKEDSICTNYLKDSKDIEYLQNEIKKKSEELETQQSEYVQKYSDELNEVYKSLGSKNFELKCVSNDRGNKKIYELKIHYRKKEVPSDNVSKVLSESDKRSLSFAVFLSKLKHLENKNEYIVVFDDPVVSFDDNRITYSANIIDRTIDDFKQVIVLTHYPSLVKKLLQKKCKGSYLEITQDNNTSFIRKLDRDNFTLSDYARAFNKIYDFIQKKHEQDILQDCRVLMEEYLRMKFAKPIHEYEIAIAPLKDFISELKKKNV